MVMRSAAVVVCLAVLALRPAPAQQPIAARAPAALSIDDLYSYEGFVKFNGKAVAAMNWVPEGGPWLDDAHYLWPDSGDNGWLRVDALTGKSDPLYSLPGVDPALRRSRPTVFSSKRDAMLLTNGSTLYYSSLLDTGITRLTITPESKTEATFSPDGRMVAFVKEHNLYLTTVDRPAERALTTDGDAKVFNGLLDWVYSEELYG